MDAEAGLIARAVVARADLVATLRDWCVRHHPDLLLLGRGTGSRDLLGLLSELPLPLRQVRESHSTRLARQRYFAENPPRGWRRLVPLSLQTPPVPIDDYAAWVLAEQYMKQGDS